MNEMATRLSFNRRRGETEPDRPVTFRPILTNSLTFSQITDQFFYIEYIRKRYMGITDQEKSKDLLIQEGIL